jgi:hypothetical protein
MENRVFTVVDWVILAIILVVFCLAQYLRIRINALN